MVFLFYQLALRPEHQDKIYEELRNVDVFNLQALRDLPHLDAVIKETLRYFPVIPTGGYRDTPPEGMTVGGTYIPGETTIVAPRFVLSRCTLLSIPSSYGLIPAQYAFLWTETMSFLNLKLTPIYCNSGIMLCRR